MIIFIHGEDSYSSEQYLKKIIAEFRAQHGLALNFIDAEEIDWDGFLGAWGGADLFHSQKMIVLRQAFAAAWKDKLAKFLTEKHGGEGIVLVIYEKGKTDGRLNLTKVLLKSPEVKEFLPPREDKVAAFLRQGLQARGKTIDQQALRLLSYEVRADLRQAESEIEKLSHLPAANITSKAVEEIAVSPAHDYIWKFLDAYAGGNKKEALNLLEKEFLAGVAPMALLYSLVRQVRMLLAFQGRRLNKAQLTKLFNIPSFAADKLGLASRKFSAANLIKILQALLRLDTALKSSRADHRLLFFLLVDSITHAPESSLR